MHGLLERGRVLNSSKRPAEAKPLFLRAWDEARAAGLDGLAVDAAHMVAIVEDPDTAPAWNGKAIAFAESSADPAAKKWLGALYNNTGWDHHRAGRFAEALVLFGKSLAWREGSGAKDVSTERWCVARCLRSLGRTEEALSAQRALLAEAEAAGRGSGYEEEEVGECLLALGRPEEARPHFRRAHELLSKDPWLVRDESPRLERLRRLGQDAPVVGQGTGGEAEREAGLDRLRVGLGALPRGQDESGWSARVEWLRALTGWLAGEPGTERVTSLVDWLRSDPEGAERLRDTVQAVLESGHALRLLADGGFPQRHSLVEEVLVRILRGVVPPVPASRDLGDVVQACFASGPEGEWLSRAPAVSIADILRAAGLEDGRLWPRLRTHLAEAVRIHGLRCANIGVAEDFRQALGRGSVASSAFFRLDEASAALLEAAAGPAPDAARCAQARAALERCVAEARVARQSVLDHLERTGVSTGLVHRLDLLARGLDRIGIALPLLAPREDESPAEAAAALLRALVSNLRHEASLINVFRDRSRLLARKIAERTGVAGAAYIAADRAAWWRMLGMGCGGGFVIAAAAYAKVSIHEIHPPPGTYSLLVFLDYAAAFLLIYAFHWTLATKQPPATAAALAEALSEGQSRHDPRPIQDLIARISRSQLAGLLGNVACTAAGCLAIDFLHRRATGRPLMEEGDAVQAILDHDPFDSGTLIYAVLTGAAVWLSSMAAGWAENAAAYGRLKDSLVPRGPLAPRTRGGRATAWIVNNIGGVVGNVSLALFLVLITFTGSVFGGVLDVRHVTISTAFVTFACSAMVDFSSSEAAWAMGGVAAVGVLNILTGFALSLSVAMRARGVTLRSRLALFRALAVAPLARPLRFLYPAGREGTP